jgi:hypothetical protein
MAEHRIRRFRHAPDLFVNPEFSAHAARRADAQRQRVATANL